MDVLKNQTQTFFVRGDVTGDGQEQDNLERMVNAYNKTGRFALCTSEEPSIISKNAPALAS